MPEIISNEQFMHELDTLGPGDVAHHSMLYPGIYSSDQETYARMRAGREFDTDTPFFDCVRAARKRGVRVEWLCTLPRTGGEFGSTDEDMQIRRRIFGTIAAIGVDVRSVVFSDHAPAVMEACGKDSPVVQDFIQGLERGDSRKSSWAFFRRQAGALVIAHLSTMDYENGAFLGKAQHYPPGPVDPDIGKWTFNWRQVYATHGEVVSPLSS